jgi:nitrate reductase NapAB chaperone NapD
MEYVDCMENFYGESVDIYENENGHAIVVFEGSRKQHIFETMEKAINKLYKMGYRF